MQHLYLHIPFCHRRCSYCDFNTYANAEDRIDAYVTALCREIRQRGVELRRSMPGTPPASGLPGLSRADLRPTVFFGGGTPTMLSIAQFAALLEAASDLIDLERAEITAEANPGTVLDPQYLRDLRSLGINRISMGVQSLHDPTLRVLGRIHTAAEARTSFEQARRAGFERINLDFMFGLPEQTLAHWEAALDEIITWGADHFSLYSLILEESTPLYAQVTAGRVTVPDDDLSGAMYEAAIERLGAAGYVQYEISNWARDEQRATSTGIPAQACQHNLAYWLNADYLACGAGAHGHRFPQRYANIRGIDAYIKAVTAGALPTAEQIDLSATDLYAETMMMGLRLNVGLDDAHFEDRCGVPLKAVYADTITELCQLELLEATATGIRLTERGRMVGNQVFAKFL
jgi:oxygen-independent coproporphyrinogen-3 oxidase